jgi:hypothetical protein
LEAQKVITVAAFAASTQVAYVNSTPSQRRWRDLLTQDCSCPTTVGLWWSPALDLGRPSNTGGGVASTLALCAMFHKCNTTTAFTEVLEVINLYILMAQK